MEGHNILRNKIDILAKILTIKKEKEEKKEVLKEKTGTK